MVNFDVKNYIKQWLIQGIRKDAFMSFVDAVFHPLAELWNEFSNWRTKQFYDVNISGQTFALQEHLNNLFDPIRRRIYISHYEEQSIAFSLSSEGYEGVPVSLAIEASGQYIALNGEVQQAVDVSFRVYAPLELNIALISAELYKYKLAGRSFDIVTN
jgi:hypothetical protein